MKHWMLAVVVTLGLVATAAGATAQGSPEGGTPAAPGTIKIGVLNPTTGPFAVFGEQVNTGIRLYFDAIGNTAGDAPVELVFADTAGDPQQALEQARRLVGQEEVDLLMGIVNSAVVPPLAEFAGEAQVPLVVTVGGARVATGPERNPYVFRTGLANGQQDRVLGWYSAEELGRRRAATFAWDFLVGEERTDGFATTFTAAGGEIVSEQRPPLGTTDYGPFISQVDPTAIDLVYAFFAGPGALAFTQQLQQFGITPTVPVVAPDYYTAGVLAEMGEDAVGLVQAGGYTPVLETPENEEFVERYQASGAEGLPGVYVAEGYVGAMVVADAIARTNGAEPQALLDALAATDLTGPAGPIRFDERGQSIRNVYLTRVEEADGGVEQALLDTVEGVSQDWMPA